MGLVKVSMKFPVVYFVSIATLVAATGGCASITGNKTQSMTVMTVCEASMIQGSSCTATNDKGVVYFTSPGAAIVQKSTGDLTVICTKANVSANPAIVRSSNNTNVWGNILLGGPIGLAVDAGTGAGFDYPPTLNVSFNPPCEGLVTPVAKPLSTTSEPTGNFSSGPAANKIRELNKLFQDGLISKSEFDEKRKILLDGF